MGEFAFGHIELHQHIAGNHTISHALNHHAGAPTGEDDVIADRDIHAA